MLSAQIERWKASNRWHILISEASAGTERYPEWRRHEVLVQRASQRKPGFVGRNVTDFTDWLFSLSQKFWSPDSKQMGREAEVEVEKARLELARKRDAVSKFIEESEGSQWKLCYRGFGENPDPALDISSLVVPQGCLRARPDLVFEDQTTRAKLILEIKVSNARDIPDSGWPNLRAQLWAYSRIDVFADAPKLYVASEVWRPNIRFAKRLPMTTADKGWHERNIQLFRLYGGSLR